ncbi:MAG: hypothetical protein ACFFCD_01600 [Promethearchaeota archaeon]
MSQKKNKLPTTHLKVLKAFFEGLSFKEISEEFDEVKYRSTAQWIVRKCQGKINESINVISEASQKDVLAVDQIIQLMGALMGALLKKNVDEMENLLSTEARLETPFSEIEVNDIDEFFKRIRKYFEKMLEE